MMNRSVRERVKQKLHDPEICIRRYVFSSELGSESEKSQGALQTSECSIKVGSRCESDSEDCTVLHEMCKTESHQHRREEEEEEEEEEQHFDISCLWKSELQQNSADLLRDPQPPFANSDCTQTLHLGEDMNSVAGTLTPLECERGRMFTCNICGKHLSTKKSLASHYRLHTGVKAFMCPQCGKSFAKKFNLDVHYNIHTGVKPYTCAVCPKSFADPSAYRRHEWIHTRKLQQNACNTKYKFTCNTCGKCFLSKPLLAAHYQQHTTEKRHSVQNVLL